MNTPPLALIVVAAGCTAFAQPAGQKTYCNPIDIDYKFGLEQIDKRISHRSGADPVIVPFKGAYYLFVTNSGGWWKSPDLLLRARYVRFENLSIVSAYLAVSDLRVFGNASGKSPGTPSRLSVRRDNDPRMHSSPGIRFRALSVTTFCGGSV